DDRPHAGEYTGRRRTAAEAAADAPISTAAATSGTAGPPNAENVQPPVAVAAAITRYSRTFHATARPCRSSGAIRACAASTSTGQTPVVRSAVASSTTTKKPAVCSAASVSASGADSASIANDVRRAPAEAARRPAARLPAILAAATEPTTTPISSGVRPKTD